MNDIFNETSSDILPDETEYLLKNTEYDGN